MYASCHRAENAHLSFVDFVRSDQTLGSGRLLHLDETPARKSALYIIFFHKFQRFMNNAIQWLGPDGGCRLCWALNAAQQVQGTHEFWLQGSVMMSESVT